jgi:hypothetical protein
VKAAAFAAALIAGAACDMIEPGECLYEGEMFGPCLAGPEPCSAGLECFEARAGAMCLPPAIAGEEWITSECAAWRGDLGCDLGLDLCLVVCGDNLDQCEGGTVCDVATRACVYPW